MTSEIRHNPMSDTHAPDGEALSALFDGELQGDAARFAMRRLGHDADWRDACGRWQLLGDVLRGQGSAQAPADFAARVETALAAERSAGAGARTGTDGRIMPAARRWTRSRMGGAALAASVAFVALLAVRPGFDDGASTAPTETLTAAPVTRDTGPSAPQTPEPSSASRLASVPQAATAAPDTREPAPAQPASELGLAAAAVAVAELPRRARSQSTRSQAQRAGLRSAREAQAPVQAAAAGGADSLIAALPPTAEPGDLHPFLPPADEIPSRPWPSATLSDYPVTALTASYSAPGAPGDRSASFYPFEPPRLTDAQAEALLEAWRLESASPPREGPRR